MTSLDPKFLFALCVTLCAAPLSDSRAGNFQKIYQFPLNASQGKQPEGTLALGPDGNFYSTTVSGGTAGKGTVFKVTPQGQHTTLYSFTGGLDGGTPYGSVVIDKAGNLSALPRLAVPQISARFTNFHRTARKPCCTRLPAAQPTEQTLKAR